MSEEEVTYPLLKWVTAKDLNRAEWNPRKLSEHKEGIVGKSIEHFGFLQPLTYNAKTKTLLDGHMRLQELDGDTQVPVYMIWVDGEQEQAVAVALNNEYGEWVKKGVMEEMTALDEKDLDIAYAGFGRETGRWLREVEDEVSQAEKDLSAMDEVHKVTLWWEDLSDKVAWDMFAERAGTAEAILSVLRQYVEGKKDE